jgi:polar amino acid transport system substrate-binding protein
MNTSTRFRIVSVAAVAALGLSMTACAAEGGGTAAGDCTPDSEFSTISSGSLTVFGPDYPPLFMSDGTTMDGVDGEILTGFAEANCLSTTITVVPAASVIEGVRGGQADVAAGGWYPTEERAEVVGQTEPAYSDPAVIVGIDPTGDLGDYKGKTIGTTQGYLWVDDLVAWGGDDIKLYQSPDAVFQDLLNGRLDAALMAVNEAGYRLQENPGTDLSYVVTTPVDFVEATRNPAVTNFPHTKDNAALGDALNAYLEKIRDSGELAEILESYGIDPSAAEPSA